MPRTPRPPHQARIAGILAAVLLLAGCGSSHPRPAPARLVSIGTGISGPAV